MDVHQRLKENTQVYHQQIERTPLINQLMSASISLEGYHALLKAFHGYIQPCERAIINSSWASLLGGREKMSRIASDFDDLKIVSLTNCQVLPPLNTREQILGYLYVMEGATLGGQIIAKILQDKLGLTAQYGARYFNGYGSDTMKMWVEFCHLINQINVLQERQVLGSASMTYTTLIDWINQSRIANEN